jgi:NADH-quinone oxidoreductase subunit M
VRYTKEFMLLMLVLEGCMLGALVSVDLFLFFLFWELMLFPMFFVIGIWGGPRRRYATMKFVLFTMTGSALMLAAMIYLVLRHAQTNPLTFDIVTLYSIKLTDAEQVLLLRFHPGLHDQGADGAAAHWLPDAHTGRRPAARSTSPACC